MLPPPPPAPVHVPAPTTSGATLAVGLSELLLLSTQLHYIIYAIEDFQKISSHPQVQQAHCTVELLQRSAVGRQVAMLVQEGGFALHRYESSELCTHVSMHSVEQSARSHNEDTDGWGPAYYPIHALPNAPLIKGVANGARGDHIVTNPNIGFLFLSARVLSPPFPYKKKFGLPLGQLLTRAGLSSPPEHCQYQYESYTAN